MAAPMLDEALKLQEMVRTESLTPRQAIEALRRTYARTVSQTSPKAQSAPCPEAVDKDNAEILLVIDLLKQAGLVSEDDISVALEVQRKHGGEMDKILIAARKIDEATLQAAMTCWPLVRDSLMKPEQAIIALHYCNRTRVSFQEALNELGFES
ncbi:MAG: hypothetical protein HY711_05005 [Candidatus Melainabacteria bacterium]|nr:hypothetical protein [Candidatus Melainabacteria bacterium]